MIYHTIICILKKIALIFCIIVLGFSSFSVWAEKNSDNNTIEDLIEDIEEEEEEEEDNDEDTETDSDSDDSQNHESCFMNACIGGFFRTCGPLLFQIFIEYMTHVRYADYPFSHSEEFDFSTIYLDNSKTKGQIGYLKTSGEASYFLDEMLGITGKIEGNLSLFHLNLYYLYLYESPLYFSIFSANAGVSLALYNFMSSFYCGMFTFDYPDNSITDILFAYGMSVYIFFHHNIYLDIFTLNAHYHSLGFHSFSASLNYSISSFSIGIVYNLHLFGYDYEDGSGHIFQGPGIKVTYWL